MSELGSKQQGYDLFKQYAAVEERNAQLEEADHVVHGVKPQGPHHRTPLERLMGGELKVPVLFTCFHLCFSALDP